MNKRHIIFLDIDGVLASEKYLSNKDISGSLRFLEPEKVMLLNQLEGAEIVITSSWGKDGGRTERLLQEAGLKLPIIDFTTRVSRTYEWACRGNEIELWLQNNFPYGMGTKFGSKWADDRYNYVIFDDDSDFLLGQKDNFICTRRPEALIQADIDAAKKILGL